MKSDYEPVPLVRGMTLAELAIRAMGSPAGAVAVRLGRWRLFPAVPGVVHCPAATDTLTRFQIGVSINRKLRTP